MPSAARSVSRWSRSSPAGSRSTADVPLADAHVGDAARRAAACVLDIARPRAVAVGHRRALRRRHRLRVPRPHRGGAGRDAQARLHRHRVARAAHAADRRSTARRTRCGARTSTSGAGGAGELRRDHLDAVPAAAADHREHPRDAQARPRHADDARRRGSTPSQLAHDIVDASLRARAPVGHRVCGRRRRSTAIGTSSPTRARCARSLGNLVQNAVKYSPDGGAIECRRSQHGTRVDPLRRQPTTGIGIDARRTLDAGVRASSTGRARTRVGRSRAPGSASTSRASSRAAWVATSGSRSEAGVGSTFTLRVPRSRPGRRRGRTHAMGIH